MRQSLDNIIHSDTIKFKSGKTDNSKSSKGETTKTEISRNPRFENTKNMYGSLSFEHLRPNTNDEDDTESEYSPGIRSHRTPPARNNRMDEEEDISTKKKPQQSRSRFHDIGSQSLRNLKKEMDREEGSVSKEQNREKLLVSLNDWLNRRLTGYLIFQNTLNSDPDGADERQGYAEKGIHLNRVMGVKWKKLSEKERGEYKKIAQDQRKVIKKELEDLDDLDSSGLYEELDDKIKKIKREF